MTDPGPRHRPSLVSVVRAAAILLVSTVALVATLLLLRPLEAPVLYPTTATLPLELWYVKLLGMVVGWLWVTLAMYLALNTRIFYPWPIPAAFLSAGVGIILIANRAVFALSPFAVFLAMLGWVIIALVAVTLGGWLIWAYPQIYVPALDAEPRDPPDADDSGPDT